MSQNSTLILKGKILLKGEIKVDGILKLEGENDKVFENIVVDDKVYHNFVDSDNKLRKYKLENK